MDRDPFKEYLRESEPDKAYKSYVWSTEIGLQAVDRLKPSEYLIDTAIQNIEGKITMKEAQELIDRYYEEMSVHSSADECTEEADADPYFRRRQYKNNCSVLYQIFEDTWLFCNQ